MNPSWITVSFAFKTRKYIEKNSYTEYKYSKKNIIPFNFYF